MVRFTTGNLLDDQAEALVNTVNTVGVMGKGIALMFKESFPENFSAYAAACKAGTLDPGSLFVTTRQSLVGPKWIINFATKDHWRSPSQLSWIKSGLQELKCLIIDQGISSVALPPLGAGNGGLEWVEVKELIVQELCELQDIDIIVYEPTKAYQNVVKRDGVEKLTPARAIILELVRRYEVLGVECSLIEAQKLSYFAEQTLSDLRLHDPMQLDFKPMRYGPYADKLRHILNSMDGSYLRSEKRINDAGPLEAISFVDSRRDKLQAYLTSPDVSPYRVVIERTAQLVDGFESPLGLELLATVHWLIKRENAIPTVAGIREGLSHWGGGKFAAERKLRLFEPRLIEIALERIEQNPATA